MDDRRLAHYAAAWEPGTWHRTIAEQELERRHKRPVPSVPWMVVALCAAALLVTVIAI